MPEQTDEQKAEDVRRLAGTYPKSGGGTGQGTGGEPAAIDWGDDADAPLACGVENPESCESCQ